MENNPTTRRRRLPHCRRGWRWRCLRDYQDRYRVAVALSAADALHRVGLFAGGAPPSHQGECVTIKVLYFASVRERVGKPEEEIEPPAEVATVGQLVAWLAARGEQYGYAFENPKVIRAAIDRKHVRPDASIEGAGEIAFFPPMTGG